MDFGILHYFRNPQQWRRPFPQYYAEQLQQIRLAEELGYDTVWLSEHHFCDDGYTPSVLPVAAAIAAVTTRIRIGTNILLLPLHNAVRVAEDAATVDIISNGRLNLGIGRGYSRREFEGYGIPLSERFSRFTEGLAVIKGMWTQEPFSFEGKHYNLKDVRLAPKPIQQHPPIWVGSQGPMMIDRTAKDDCHLISTGHSDKQQIYDGALEKYGRSVSDHNICHMVWTHVADTYEQAWDNVQEHLHYMFSMYAQWWAETESGSELFNQSLPPMPPAAELRNTLGEDGGVIAIGTADQVAERLERLRQTTRTSHVCLAMHLPGLHPDKSRRSMELFAQRVMPQLRK